MAKARPDHPAVAIRPRRDKGDLPVAARPPPLAPTDIVDGREQRVWKMPPSADRAKLRSKTFPGIARAMAEQWAGPVEAALKGGDR